MNVNQKIERALSSLVKGNIWALECPLETKPEEWILYLPELEKPSLWGDDEALAWTHYMQIHWFSKSREYTGVRKEIRRLLSENGFSVTGMDYAYEADTGYAHLTVSCSIEEEDADGN